MNKSSIEWCDYTWNPVTGCSHVSEGCRNCYAEGVANRFWGERKFTDVECHDDRLAQPLKVKKGARVFVNSMSDLFHEKVPFDYIDKVMAVIALCPQHTFLVLTKRPERMLEYFGPHRKDVFFEKPIKAVSRLMEFPDWINLPSGRSFPRRPEVWPLPNLWLGASCHDQDSLDYVMRYLQLVPAAIRWISHEPALGPANFKPYLNKLQWIVAGGESGPGARPSHPDWFRRVRDQCVEAGVPFFFKQWGEYQYELREWGPDGEPWSHKNEWFKSRIGKKKAGRLLDGQEWNQFPEVD